MKIIDKIKNFTKMASRVKSDTLYYNLSKFKKADGLEGVAPYTGTATEDENAISVPMQGDPSQSLKSNQIQGLIDNWVLQNKDNLSDMSRGDIPLNLSYLSQDNFLFNSIASDYQSQQYLIGQMKNFVPNADINGLNNIVNMIMTESFSPQDDISMPDQASVVSEQDNMDLMSSAYGRLQELSSDAKKKIMERARWNFTYATVEDDFDEFLNSALGSKFLFTEEKGSKLNNALSFFLKNPQYLIEVAGSDGAFYTDMVKKLNDLFPGKDAESDVLSAIRTVSSPGTLPTKKEEFLNFLMARKGDLLYEILRSQIDVLSKDFLRWITSLTQKAKGDMGGGREKSYTDTSFYSGREEGWEQNIGKEEEDDKEGEEEEAPEESEEKGQHIRDKIDIGLFNDIVKYYVQDNVKILQNFDDVILEPMMQDVSQNVQNSYQNLIELPDDAASSKKISAIGQLNNTLFDYNSASISSLYVDKVLSQIEKLFSGHGGVKKTVNNGVARYSNSYGSLDIGIDALKKMFSLEQLSGSKENIMNNYQEYVSEFNRKTEGDSSADTFQLFLKKMVNRNVAFDTYADFGEIKNNILDMHSSGNNIDRIRISLSNSPEMMKILSSLIGEKRLTDDNINDFIKNVIIENQVGSQRNSLQILQAEQKLSNWQGKLQKAQEDLFNAEQAGNTEAVVKARKDIGGATMRIYKIEEDLRKLSSPKDGKEFRAYQDRNEMRNKERELQKIKNKDSEEFKSSLKDLTRAKINIPKQYKTYIGQISYYPMGYLSKVMSSEDKGGISSNQSQINNFLDLFDFDPTSYLQNKNYGPKKNPFDSEGRSNTEIYHNLRGIDMPEGLKEYMKLKQQDLGGKASGIGKIPVQIQALQKKYNRFQRDIDKAQEKLASLRMRASEAAQKAASKPNFGGTGTFNQEEYLSDISLQNKVKNWDGMDPLPLEDLRRIWLPKAPIMKKIQSEIDTIDRSRKGIGKFSDPGKAKKYLSMDEIRREIDKKTEELRGALKEQGMRTDDEYINSLISLKGAFAQDILMKISYFEDMLGRMSKFASAKNVSVVSNHLDTFYKVLDNLIIGNL